MKRCVLPPLAFAAALLIGGCIEASESPAREFESAPALEQTLRSHPPIATRHLGSGRIGVGLIPRNYDSSEAAWTEALRVARNLGAEILQLPSGYWNEDEPVKGAYQWQAMQRLVDAMEHGSFEFEISQDFGGVFFHARSTAPAYLGKKTVKDAELVDAYLRYLGSYLERFGSRVSTVLIHAEGAYSYFDENPDHFDAYLRFLQRVRTFVRERWPNVRVGVNIDPHNQPRILSGIAAVVDLMGFDLVQIDGVLDKPSDLEGVVNGILQHTGGKPVSIATGWSSSTQSAGGEEDQALLFRELFRVLRLHRERIAYVAVGTPFDEDLEIIGPAYRAQFANLPADFVTKIIEWITHLGLLREDGSPKPAWGEVRTQIEDYYEWSETTAASSAHAPAKSLQPRDSSR